MNNIMNIGIPVISILISFGAVHFSKKAAKHAAESNDITKKYSSLNESHAIDNQFKEILSIYADINYRVGNIETTKYLVILDKKGDIKDDRISATIYLLTLIVAMEPRIKYIEDYNKEINEITEPLSRRLLSETSNYELVNLLVLKEFSNIVIKKVEEDTKLKQKVELIRPGICNAANVVNKSYENIVSFNEIFKKYNFSLKEKDRVLMVAIPANGVATNRTNEERSLGPWPISKKNMEAVKYIIGISLSSRIIVSIIEVEKLEHYIDENGKNQVMYSTIDCLYQWADGKNMTILKEAILWNPQNPIKYLK